MTHECPATGYDVIARVLDDAAGWAEDAIAGGDPPKWVIRQLVTASRLIAAAARGEPVTL